VTAPPPPIDHAAARRRFRVTLVRVMVVQIVTLALLGYLQYIFTP
jgi:hypothetical protein